MADASLPTPSLMRRFLAALRWVEAQPQGGPGRPLGGKPGQSVPLYARITAHAADGYSWIQSWPKADGTWEDTPNGFESATSGKAFEVGGRTDIAADTVVRLESRQTSDGLPIWVFGTGLNLVRFGKPTGAFSSGATMTLDPCDAHGTDTGEANATVYVQADKSSYTMCVDDVPTSTTIPTTEIVPFVQAADGLFYVLGRPKIILTAFQVVTGTQKLQVKRRDDWGAFCGTESGWFTVHTGDVCA